MWIPELLRERLAWTAQPLAVHQRDTFDLAFTIDGPEGSRSMLVEVKSRWLRAALPSVRASFEAARARSMVPVLAVPLLSPAVRGELREAGINHIDLDGALFIREPGLLVDIHAAPHGARYAPARLRDRDDDDRVGGVNPFSDSASIVLRLLLRDGRRSWRIQDLAAAGSVNPGWVTTVARALESRGYAKRSRRGSGRDSDLQMADPVAALRDWTDAYGWRDNHTISYQVPFEYHELADHLRRRVQISRAHHETTAPPDIALTLHSGADMYAPHVRHEQMHVYVRRERLAELDEWARTTLHAGRAETGGNLHLIQPYYRRSALFDAGLRNGLPVVSPLQLYLDLIHYPVRGREAADILARTVIGPEWELSPERLRMLLA